ncbi:sulfotransferase family 2 domain-containing protein [Thermococcus sp.]|uniref:sulfotransferase family 2 domain-containing protein n=1 Tax=Thermococcus sp. TaxID=35749 RepID=UPI00261B4647|nr:sulfotransferase family 2 domain-containing protein [Thermococcus sp.]MCD6143412.1 sulfotransferase family 2 domain-containing protein [Thermococcus sp.]
MSTRIEKLRNSKYETIIFRNLAKITGRRLVHFLHIGKTGGTSIKYALRWNFFTKNYIISLHRHSTTLEDIPEGEYVFFFVRDPIGRFVSGFYSRLREGKPRHYKPHTPEEKKAFSKFKTPNELAEALSSSDSEIKKAAMDAMKAIGHVKTSYWDWFKDEDYFTSRVNDIVFVGRQEYLSQDFEKLKKILGLPPSLTLPQSDVLAHKTPDYYDKRLSELAVKNLRKWYKKDYEFLKLCEELGLLPEGSYDFKD